MKKIIIGLLGFLIIAPMSIVASYHNPLKPQATQYRRPTVSVPAKVTTVSPAKKKKKPKKKKKRKGKGIRYLENYAGAQPEFF